jgi:hypothetical protein
VTVTYTPPPKAAISDGTWVVGSDIKAGLYKTAGDGECYWARLKDLTGGLDSIRANGNIDGPTTIQVLRSDKALELNGGCDWRKA